MAKKIPEIRVVFDTNALYTKVASDLFNHEISELIKLESDRRDIKITWYLPDVVIKERQYQMKKEAKLLEPSLKQWEKLLNINLNLTNEILEKRVEECVLNHIKKYKVQILELDCSKVDWKHLVHRSCFRLLPFSPVKEEKGYEKGFRDSLIAETFFQLIDFSPKSATKCKIVFITKDTDLKSHIEDRIKNKNVVVLQNIEELKGLINTLASEIDEITIQKYQVLASQYFFDKENKTCLYYKEKLGEQIRERYKSELLVLPSGENLKRQNTTWIISRPQFIEKNRTKVSWNSRVEVLCEIYKEEITSSIFNNDFNTHIGLSASELGSSQRIYPPQGLLHNVIQPTEGYLSGLTTTKKIISKGKTVFDILWTVNIVNNKLTHPTINEIKFIGTFWED